MPALAPPRDVGTSLLRANSVFEPQPLAAQELPHRVMRDFHAARRKGGLQPVQRQVWRPVDLLHNERPVRLQNTLAVAAHLGRRDRTRCPVALRPLHRRRDGNAETRCGRPAAFAGFDRIHNTFAKIIGKGSVI